MVGHLHYVLSMGTVFGLFAGFFYWFPLITGYLYDEVLARAQFYIMFIGCNITFFPMHILGVSGMPRRIPDYPSMYQILNTVCSFGSLISIFGMCLWFYIVYDAIENAQRRSPRNP